MKNNSKLVRLSFLKFIIITAGIFAYSIGLKWFVYSGNILPSGFTGLGILLQKLCIENFNIEIPLTVFNVGFNIIPAMIAFRIVGKKFTIISFVIMFAFTFIADIFSIRVLTPNPLLSAIFGGIICGFGASLWFKSGVSGGGTDFIALSLSTKYHIQTFSYIMGFNVILIIIQGILFGLEPAFYSIVYQYVQTQTINSFYKHYEAKTIFIITEKPVLVSKMLIKETGHSATQFDGIGCYTNNEKYMLYMVATTPELRKIINTIKKYDKNAFINVLQSNLIQGNFNYLPVSIDDVDESL